MKQHYQGLGHIAVYTADMDASIAFYEKIGGSDTTDPYWVQFAVDFTLKEAVSQLSIRFTADLASAFAIDDVQLVEGNASLISPSMWTMWTKPPRISAPPAWTPSRPQRSA